VLVLTLTLITFGTGVAMLAGSPRIAPPASGE